MDSVKRDIALSIAREIYAAGVHTVKPIFTEEPTPEVLIQSAQTLATNALILGEIWAEAQIEYCKRGCVPMTEEQVKLLEGKVW